MRKALHFLAAMFVSGSALAQIQYTPCKTSDFDRFKGTVTATEKAPVLSRATQSMNFTYAQDPYTAYALNGTTAGVTRIFVAFEIPPEDLALLKGNKITSVNIVAGTDGKSPQRNLVTDVKVFVAETLGSTPSNIQAGKMSDTPFGTNYITLDNPYEITSADKSLYVGCYYIIPSVSPYYYLTVDGVPTDRYTCLYATSNNDTFPTKWGLGSSEIGSACISCTIEGDNLPNNFVEISDSKFPTYVKPGAQASYSITVHNLGVNKINKLQVTTEVEGSDPVSTDLACNIQPGNSASCTINNIAFNNPGYVNITSTITTVNSTELQYSNPSVTSPVAVYSDGYDRNVVVEEGTGTWCGWCPAGMVMMDYIKKTYPDRIMRIAVHSGDEMEASTYSEFVDDYISGFPCAIFNRSFQLTPTVSDANSYVDDIFDSFTQHGAYCKVDFSGSVNSDKLVVNSSTRFIIDSSVPHYLSFALVEDNVGPYYQTNYYAGGSRGKMGGWELKGSQVRTTFEDVARDLYSYPGLEGSLPDNIKKDTDYTFSTEIPLRYVSNDDFRVVAMITNAITGEIVNASEKSFNKKDSSGGVDSVAADKTGIKVSADNGTITVSGADSFKVFTLEGREVSATGLASGIYIVSAGGESVKVIIR